MALVPLGIWTARLDAAAEGHKSAVLGGAALGAVYFGVVFHWVPLALVAVDTGVPSIAYAVGAYLVIVVGLSCLSALSVRLFHHAVHSFDAPLWLALAVTWTALEWTRAHLPDALALPWLGLGTSLTAYPELVGAAEVVGARGMTFWLATVNGLVAMAWLRRRRGARAWVGPAAGAVALVASVAGWGIWRARTLDSRPIGDVAIVQPDAARRTKVTDEVPTPEDVAAALPMVRAAGGARRPPEQPYALVAASADLVILPELFLRADPRSPDAAEAVAVLRDFSRAMEAAVLFGGLGTGPSRSGGERTSSSSAERLALGQARAAGLFNPALFNSAFLMEPEGLADFRYDKRRLVPVVERIPSVRNGTARGERGGDAMGGNGMGGYAVGHGWPLAEVDGTRYGVLICYESSYPDVARALRREGADVLVNITNDAWLGGRGPFARTVALWQHPAHLVMRAIEGRVGVVRAAATGISMFVDPVGRTHETAGVSMRAVRIHSVHTVDGPTFFVRYGDLLGNASALLALGLLLHVTLRVRGLSLDPQGPLV